MCNISNKDENDIWDVKEVKQEIYNYTQILPYIIYEQNNGYENQILKNKYNIVLGISNDLKLEKGSYNKLKNKYADLEIIIEILFNILTSCGYNRDKGIRKVTSGIHDVSHAIYGTYCDELITNDQKFYKRCKAVYNYLGIKTKVLTLNDFLNEI